MVTSFETQTRRLPRKTKENRTRFQEYNQFPVEILTEYLPKTSLKAVTERQTDKHILVFSSTVTRGERMSGISEGTSKEVVASLTGA